MSGCVRLSDRMPDVALDRGRWRPDEQAHLDACPDCRAEWELVLAAGRLGARAPVPRDGERRAAEVLRRLREAPPARPARVAAWAAGLAAAAAVAGIVWTAAGPADPASPEAAVAIEESLTTAQVDSLLEDDDPPLAGWSMLEAPTLGDLDEDELEQVLRTWEG